MSKPKFLEVICNIEAIASTIIKIINFLRSIFVNKQIFAFNICTQHHHNCFHAEVLKRSKTLAQKTCCDLLLIRVNTFAMEKILIS